MLSDIDADIPPRLLVEHLHYWRAITGAYPDTAWTPDRLNSASVACELLELIGVLQAIHADGVEPSTKRGAFTLERSLRLFVLVLRGLDR